MAAYVARRSANEGTVFQNSSGRWMAMIELPRRGDGSRHRRLRRARTKAEAQQFLREMRDELHRTGTVSNGQRTAREAIESYGNSRPTSDQDDWASRLIVEGLGAVRTVNLTVAQCDGFLEAAALGLGNRRAIGKEQMSKLRQFMVAALRNEMRIGHLSRNVADLSVKPVIDDESRDRRALSAEELQALLAAATGSRLIIVELCGRNGLRPAEARAVRWSDVNLDRMELSVTGQMNRENERGEVKKATNAARTIALDGVTVSRLKVWREDQGEMRVKAGSAWQDVDIVASMGQGAPVDRNSPAKSLRLLCRRAGIDPAVTPYELRHTAISVQADAGRSSWDISDWAGTSEAMINRVYRHRLRRVASLLPADDRSRQDVGAPQVRFACAECGARGKGSRRAQPCLWSAPNVYGA